MMYTALLIIICSFASVFAAIGFMLFASAVAYIYAEWEWKRMADRQDARDAKERMAEGGTITFEELDRELEAANAKLKIGHDELRRRVKANTLKLTGREVI